MPPRRIPRSELVHLWQTHGIALCAEAQADGVPCTAIGRNCETCEQAFAAWLATHPERDLQPATPEGTTDVFPECGP